MVGPAGERSAAAPCTRDGAGGDVVGPAGGRGPAPHRRRCPPRKGGDLGYGRGRVRAPCGLYCSRFCHDRPGVNNLP